MKRRYIPPDITPLSGFTAYAVIGETECDNGGTANNCFTGASMVEYCCCNGYRCLPGSAVA